MKKIISIVMTFMLVFMTVGPLPTAFAASFSGSVAGSTAKTPGTGTVTVTNATSGETLQLYRENVVASVATHKLTSNEHTFSGLGYGKYYVTSTGNGDESNRSPAVEVKPETVTIVEHGEDVVNNQVTFTGAYHGATVFLQNARLNYSELKVTADAEGKGRFEKVPPGKNYRVYQDIDGVKSELSTTWVNVLPNQVQLNVIPPGGAGPDNNGGSIRVSDTEPGNRLYIYRKDEANSFDDQIVGQSDGNTYIFTGLSAGEYQVAQEKNGVLSIKSNSAKISDDMKPTIELVGPATVRFSMPYEYKPHENDVIAKDNIKVKEIKWKVSPDVNINTPGEYKITYTAWDDANNEVSVTKTVIIAPPTLSIIKTTDTLLPNETKPGRATGDFLVSPVMANATLYLYQDPNGKLIDTITVTNGGEFPISNIPVGKNYYVIQVVNKIASDPSARADIKDNTPPSITLKGNNPVKLVRGDKYIEYGATATDNVDKVTELSSKIVIDSSAVNMEVPGEYIVKYNVMDAAGNVAIEVLRKVVVAPHAVIAIGSYADLGEVSVKNAFPGSTLELYSVTDPNKPVAVSKELATNATTYVFKHPTTENATPDISKKIAPGSYYVIQKFSKNGTTWASAPSNIVDVVDTNRPYITILGSENLSFVWDITKNEYTYDAIQDIGQFIDPGATADDYLDKKEDLIKNIKKKVMFDNTELCNENTSTTKCPNPFDIVVPGIYTITYSVTTDRGAKADDKKRIVTVAPPQVGDLLAKSGESTIEVTKTFNPEKAETIVNLYNAQGQLIESQKLSKPYTTTTIFKEVPASLGYYVTQTVNGIESAPSNPINVSVFEDAKDAAMITAFGFKLGTETVRAHGTIDHKAGTIEVVVPKNTDIIALKATFTATGTVKIGGIKQESNVTPVSFTNSVNAPVKYTVESKAKSSTDGIQTKDYEVKVTSATFDTNTWTTTVNKSVVFSAGGGSTALTLDERSLAVTQGVSFIGKDRAIHIPPANVVETTTPVLTVKTLTSVQGPAALQATEIGWGNSTKPFVQPIEIEMPTNTVSGKKFARFVHANNQTFAIIQPSVEQVAVGASKTNTIIGLVAQPGTYAFVNDLAAPKITGTANAYQIAPVLGAQIYYTTNSSHIAYDSSAARKEALANYTLESLDLSNWTRYTGQSISTPSGELYAFAMKDGIISPLANAITIAPTEWKKTITRPAAKPLSITFNAKVDRKALYTGLIYVIDDSTNKEVPVKLSLSANGKTMIVSPITAFNRGSQYTLYIDRKFKGNTKNNEFLKQPLTQTFIAE